jgi:hypothetical protein
MGLTDRYTHLVPYSAISVGQQNMKYYDQYPWRWLISPFRPNSNAWKKNCNGYAIDNGAFVYGKRGLPFDEEPFLKDVDAFGEGADFIVIPDVLYNAEETLSIAERWIERLEGYPLLIVAQDGMTKKDLEVFTRRGIGVFIGGSTEFKLGSMKWVADLCNQYRVLCHVGRVNSALRMSKCLQAGAHSFDGSGPARFENTCRVMTTKLLNLEQDLFKRGEAYDEIKNKYIKTGYAPDYLM